MAKKKKKKRRSDAGRYGIEEHRPGSSHSRGGGGRAGQRKNGPSEAKAFRFTVERVVMDSSGTDGGNSMLMSHEAFKAHGFRFGGKLVILAIVGDGDSGGSKKHFVGTVCCWPATCVRQRAIRLQLSSIWSSLLQEGREVEVRQLGSLVSTPLSVPETVAIHLVNSSANDREGKNNRLRGGSAVAFSPHKSQDNPSYFSTTTTPTNTTTTTATHKPSSSSSFVISKAVRQYLTTAFRGEVVAEGCTLMASVEGRSRFFRVEEISARSVRNSTPSSPRQTTNVPPRLFKLGGETRLVFQRDAARDSSQPLAALQGNKERNSLEKGSAPPIDKGSSDGDSLHGGDGGQIAATRFVDIGGLGNELKRIRQTIEAGLGLLPKHIFNSSQATPLRPPKGLLLFGPPGTGKTMIARAVASEFRAAFITVNSAEILGRYVGDAEERLSRIFQEAEEKAPSIIFFDEIDAICPSRDSSSGVNEHTQRLTATLLTLLDGANMREARVVVIAATNKPNDLDEALRRPGRMDREVAVGIPNEEGRFEILTKMLRSMPHRLSEREIRHCCSISHGYVGADLRSLCQEAAFATLNQLRENRRRRRGRMRVRVKKEELSMNHLPHAAGKAVGSTTQSSSLLKGKVSSNAEGGEEDSSCNERGGIVNVENDELKEAGGGGAAEEESITFGDFQRAFATVQPSAMREVSVEVPKVSWEDVGGQWQVKQRLKEAVEWPLRYPHKFKRMGIRPPRGVLLYGPPGCSKTLMAKALAHESSRNFLAVKGPELFSMYVGESERAVRDLFSKARAASPSIVFMDEVDALAVSRSDGSEGNRARDRVLGQLLSELDGMQPLENVVVIAATNRPDRIDAAMLRPGRIDRMLYVGLPDRKSREEIAAIQLKGMAHDSGKVSPSLIAEMTEGFSGAEVCSLCKQAAAIALEEDIDAEKVRAEHFEAARKENPPRITEEMVQWYKNFQSESLA